MNFTLKYFIGQVERIKPKSYQDLFRLMAFISDASNNYSPHFFFWLRFQRSKGMQLAPHTGQAWNTVQGGNTIIVYRDNLPLIGFLNMTPGEIFKHPILS